MIAHISIGVREIERSKRFYDAVLEPLGYKCLRPAQSMMGYGYGRDSIALWVVQAERPVPADEKSGLHICFTAPDSAAVERFTRRRWPQAGMIMVRPVCARYTALITTPPLSSIRTDTGSRRITVQPRPEVSYNQSDRLPLARIEPEQHYTEPG
jgi:catechol 2,3-dioxygenase-like lactoylglutathione lyase family enzyme